MLRKKRMFLWRQLRYRFFEERWHSYVRRDNSDFEIVSMGKRPWHQDFCADPFFFYYGEDLWLFYETLNRGGKGILGCFKFEDDAWSQKGIVLEEPWHLSYPQVFEDKGNVFMIPESGASGEVSLYQTQSLPYGWEKVATLLTGHYADSTLLVASGKYWLFAYSVNPEVHLELWMADQLEGPWKLHPKGRMIANSKRLSRPAGRCLVEDGQLFRVAQDCNGDYGKRVFRIPIYKLTPTEYTEGRAELLLDGKSYPKSSGKHTYNHLRFNDEHYVVVDSKKFYVRRIDCIIKYLFRVLLGKVRRFF